MYARCVLDCCTAGMFVGLMSDRGRGSMREYVGNVVYTIVALGMLSTVRVLACAQV